MANLDRKIDAERRMRELLRSGDLPEPDWVEYGYECIRLFFEDSMTVVVVELDDDS